MSDASKAVLLIAQAKNLVLENDETTQNNHQLNKILKELVDLSAKPYNASECSAFCNELLRCDHIIDEGMLSCYLIAILSNLCQHSNCDIDPALALRFLLLLIDTHKRSNQVLQFALSAISNLCHLSSFSINKDDCLKILQLTAIIHHSALIIDAWCSTMCNLIIRFSYIRSLLIENGIVSIIQKLLLFYGDNKQINIKGLLCLAHLSLPIMTLLKDEKR